MRKSRIYHRFVRHEHIHMNCDFKKAYLLQILDLKSFFFKVYTGLW